MHQDALSFSSDHTWPPQPWLLSLARKDQKQYTQAATSLQTKQPERQTKKCSFCRHAPLKESPQLHSKTIMLLWQLQGWGCQGQFIVRQSGGNLGQHGRLVISGCEPWDSLNALSASSTMLLRLCELRCLQAAYWITPCTSWYCTISSACRDRTVLLLHPWYLKYIF